MKITVDLEIKDKGYILSVNGKEVGNGSHYSMLTNKDLINCFIQEMTYNEELTKELDKEELQDFLYQLKRITTTL